MNTEGGATSLYPRLIACKPPACARDREESYFRRVPCLLLRREILGKVTEAVGAKTVGKLLPEIGSSFVAQMDLGAPATGQ